jgi:hypothetical protein
MASSTDKGVKRTRDFYEGMMKREKDAEYLNDYLYKHHIYLQFKRFHPDLKAMNTNEKVKNNISENYLKDKGDREGMSLHYQLRNLINHKAIPFIFAYEDSGGVYLKLPKDYKEAPALYLNLLADNNYHILIVGKESILSHRVYSRIISFKDILKNPQVWQWGMGTSKGNTNRLQFFGSMSSIKYKHPEEPSLFEGSLIEELKKLFDEKE